MGLCLFFLPNFPGAMFIQGATFIPDSRVVHFWNCFRNVSGWTLGMIDKVVRVGWLQVSCHNYKCFESTYAFMYTIASLRFTSSLEGSLW